MSRVKSSEEGGHYRVFRLPPSSAGRGLILSCQVHTNLAPTSRAEASRRAVKSRFFKAIPMLGAAVPAPFRMSPVFGRRLDAVGKRGRRFRPVRPSGLPFPLFRTGLFLFQPCTPEAVYQTGGDALRRVLRRPAPFGPSRGPPVLADTSRRPAVRRVRLERPCPFNKGEDP